MLPYVILMDGDPDKLEGPEIDHLKSDNIEDYLGKNQAFYKVLQHYTQLYTGKYNGDIEALLRVRPPSFEPTAVASFWSSPQVGILASNCK